MKLMRATLEIDVYFVVDGDEGTVEELSEGLQALEGEVKENGIGSGDVQVTPVKAKDGIPPEWMESIPWGAHDDRKVSVYMQDLIAAEEKGRRSE